MVAGSSGILQVFIRTLCFPPKEIGSPSTVLSSEVTLIYIRIILIVGLKIVLGSWVGGSCIRMVGGRFTSSLLQETGREVTVTHSGSGHAEVWLHLDLFYSESSQIC